MFIRAIQGFFGGLTVNYSVKAYHETKLFYHSNDLQKRNQDLKARYQAQKQAIKDKAVADAKALKDKPYVCPAPELNQSRPEDEFPKTPGFPSEKVESLVPRHKTNKIRRY